MATNTNRLTAMRHSHCDTCGCARCKWIDEALGVTGEGEHGIEEPWLIEGTLLADEGRIVLAQDGQLVPLDEALAGRLGYHVVILVGAIHEDRMAG